jgi:HlyD family secretion protein
MATNVAAGVKFPTPGSKKHSLAELIEREKRRKQKRRRLILVLAGLLPVFAIALWAAVRPKPVPLAERFRTGTASRGEIVREVHATGQLEAITTVQVGAEISGRIASVEVDYNDRVKAGQVLARFDPTALAAQQSESQATLAAVRAELAQAKTDREKLARDKERADRLLAAGVMSQSERDSIAASARLMEQRVAAAEAQLAAQRGANKFAVTNLEHTIVRSPIDGIVITRHVDPGQTVAATFQTPVLFTVAADLRRMHVIAAVDEADIGEVAVKQPATFTVNAYPDRTFEGVVVEVRSSPEVVQDVVTYGTEVEVDNRDLALKPGMTATVRIRTAFAKDVLRVPAAAFQFTPPGRAPDPEPGVWILSRDTLRRAPAKPGISNGELTAIASGAVAPGDEVVYELTAEGRKAYGIGH